jgi:hypothetical protein
VVVSYLMSKASFPRRSEKAERNWLAVADATFRTYLSDPGRVAPCNQRSESLREETRIPQIHELSGREPNELALVQFRWTRLPSFDGTHEIFILTLNQSGGLFGGQKVPECARRMAVLSAQENRPAVSGTNRADSPQISA